MENLKENLGPHYKAFLHGKFHPGEPPVLVYDEEDEENGTVFGDDNHPDEVDEAQFERHLKLAIENSLL
jgi:hypothetical protein